MTGTLRVIEHIQTPKLKEPKTDEPPNTTPLPFKVSDAVCVSRRKVNPNKEAIKGKGKT